MNEHETENFIITNVEWKYAESRELGRTASASVKVGIKSADVTCKKCNHEWSANRGNGGGLLPALGGTIFDCPKCSASEQVSGDLIKM